MDFSGVWCNLVSTRALEAWGEVQILHARLSAQVKLKLSV